MINIPTYVVEAAERRLKQAMGRLEDDERYVAQCQAILNDAQEVVANSLRDIEEISAFLKSIGRPLPAQIEPCPNCGKDRPSYKPVCVACSVAMLARTAGGTVEL